VNKWHSKHRLLAVGISCTGSGAGAMAIGPLVSWLVPLVGWRVMMRIFSSLLGSMSVIGAATFIPINVTTNPSFEVRDKLSYRDICSIKAMKYLMVVLTLWPLAYAAVLTHIIDYALTVGISSNRAYSLLVYWGAASVCGRFFGGLFSSNQ